MTTRRLASTLCAATMFATFAISMAGQSPTDLGKRNARSKYTLGRITGLRELPDGRVVVADSKEGVFRLIDLGRGDVGLIGKQGDGPDEYRTAAGVLPLPGDSLMLYDGAGRKFLHLGPSGTIASVVPFPATPNRSVRPTVSDATGAYYYTVLVIDTVAKSTRTSLHRFRPGATTDEELVPITTRRADQVKLNGMVPFVFRDFWGVREDGLVARVVSDTYQVIWSRDGKETGRTGPLPFQPIPITAAEQQTIRDSLAQMFKGGPGGPGQMIIGGPGGAGGGRGVSLGDGGGPVRTVVIGGGGGGGGAPVFFGGGAGAPVAAGGGPPASTGDGRGGRGPVTPMTAADSQRMKDAMAQMAKMADVPAENFPATKPAMPSGGTNIATFDANGMLWVARERARGDANPRYDIIAEGKGIVAQVKLPADTRLVGFGKGVVYLARTEDGSDWLERYPMPKY